MTKIVYLTNSSGEPTGYGVNNVTGRCYDKVAFEEGPGVLLVNLVELKGGGRVYAAGVLELAYADDFWGDDQDFAPYKDTRRLAKAIAAFADSRKGRDHLILTDKGDPGRISVMVLIPLDQVEDAEHLRAALLYVFGPAACEGGGMRLLRTKHQRMRAVVCSGLVLLVSFAIFVMDMPAPRAALLAFLCVFCLGACFALVEGVFRWVSSGEDK